MKLILFKPIPVRGGIYGVDQVIRKKTRPIEEGQGVYSTHTSHKKLTRSIEDKRVRFISSRIIYQVIL
jgi:hypothetical protein